MLVYSHDYYIGLVVAIYWLDDINVISSIHILSDILSYINSEFISEIGKSFSQYPSKYQLFHNFRQ